jgi:two-component system, cell cycle sensor histidine kinase and response regulator CckA
MDHESWHTIGVVNRTGQLQLVSGRAPALLGIAIDTLAERAFADSLRREDRPKFSSALAEAMQAGGDAREVSVTLAGAAPARTLTCRLTALHGAATADSLLLDVQLPCVGEAARPEALAQGHEAARSALRHKTAELQAVLQTLPDLFVRFDADGRFLDFRAPSGAGWCAPPGFFLGKHPGEVMPPDVASALDRARLEAHRRGSLVTLEYELALADTPQYFEARYVPFIAGQTIAMVRNVTERRQAELALLLSEARLRESQKIEAVGRLAGGVAHDFNNILLVIAGYTAAIGRHLPADHPAAAALHQITKAGERASALTKQLLALSRRQAIRPTRLDLGQILIEMHDMLARVMGKSILLSTRVAPNLAGVVADRSQIEQIVLNLVLNAEEAMPGGGQLNIVAENVPLDESGQAGKRALGDAAVVALSVSDTGSGMDPETRARMFEPFFTTKARGTGLGLFMVQQIVRESGGKLAVVSQLGRGTRIVVELPACPESSAPAQADTPVPRVRAALERPDAATAAVARPA